MADTFNTGRAARLEELEELASRHQAVVELRRRADGLWSVRVDKPATMAMLVTKHAPLGETLRRAVQFLDDTDALDGLVSASKAGGPL